MDETVDAGTSIFVVILIWIVIGLVIGAVARVLMPAGRLGFFGTVLCGIGGALIAGFIGRYIAEPLWLHLLLAVLGAAVLVGIFGRS